MALADLIVRLEEEAQSRVQAIEREAEAEVRNIEAAADRAIAEITEHHREAERADRHSTCQRELAIARRHARAGELEARHAQLSRILQRARALIPVIAADPVYNNALPSHLHEALAFLEGMQPRVRCSQSFVERLRAAVADHDGAELVTDDSVGPGIVAEAGDGAVIVDNTLEARLLRSGDRMRIDLLRKLGDAGF